MYNLHVNARILHHSFLFSGSLPNTFLYYKACTKHFPILLCTTKLAQSTSQYYFVLQSLYKLLHSTTLYYKACTKHVPILFCFIKFARTTSQHSFVLQSLHKARSNTTLYYKVCTKHFPVLLCTSQRCSPFKAAVQSYSASKLLRTAAKLAPKSCFRKRIPKISKAIPQSYHFSKQMHINAAFKAAKLFPAVAPQSCSSKLLPKAASKKCFPKLQCCYPKLPQSWSGRLSKAAPQNYCPKLFPGAAPQSCAPKLLP